MNSRKNTQTSITTNVNMRWNEMRGGFMMNPNPGGTPPSPKEVNPPNNRVDAFTDFINEWIDTNVKVFTRGGKHDGEML
jgi:hypothetical protein